METIVLGSTKTNYNMPIEEALNLSSYAAGVCYMKDDIEQILNEDIEKTKNRIDLTLNSGHHSVFQHVHYTLVFKDIPKIIAMIINNEKMYTTSEKSARYTVMGKLPEEEKVLYTKWVEIFKGLIKKQYPLLLEPHVKKLAMENARYLISVFTPTTMVYTTNLVQINYIIEMLENFIVDADKENNFFNRLIPEIEKFIETLLPFKVEGMSRKNKNVKLSLIRLDSFGVLSQYYGDVYDTSYLASFAQVAQAQRHRTISYTGWQILLYNDVFYDTDNHLYTPPIIENTKLSDEWIKDILSLPENTFPQAMKMLIQERGTYENFILKCHERLCCQAQNEIMQQTKDTFTEYLKNADSSHQIHSDFPNITHETFTSKTHLKNIWCAGKCNNFGRRYALNRNA